MSKKQRIAAGIEYCGANYSGWQYQDNADSVQGRVERAVSRVADEGVRVVAAGRTDTGVHGSGQVIHFDTHNPRESRAWLRGVNTHLPDDISLLWAQPVEADFHARFSAVERAYRYVILNRPVSPSYLHGRVAWHYAPLAVAQMRRAARMLVGCHDFSAFRAAGCQARDPRKTIHGIRIGHSGAWIWIDVSADGFLYRMVRNLAGTLMRIGEGRAAVGYAGELLASGDRSRAGVTAPAAGLYFTAVKYPQRFALPSPPAPCQFWRGV